ncbi:MAG: hypothetical protein V4664_03675 [Patescibacteria group bacterium]
MPAKEKQLDILDAKGQPILKGSIVGMIDPCGHWSRYQGLVLELRSDIEDQGYTVAVFFNREVDQSYFFARRSRRLLPVREWDREFLQQCVKGDTSFLLVDDAWKKCPRVIFFRPKELAVQGDWKIKTLAKRLFGNSYHRLYLLSAGLPSSPSAYQCWLEGCAAPATRTALFNVCGSVYPMYTCEACFSKNNGFCGDDLPPMKKPMLAVDGTPILIK